MRFNTLKGTYESQRSDGSFDDHRNLEMVTDPRFLTHPPARPKKQVQASQLRWKAPQRHSIYNSQAKGSPEFLKAKRSLESALANSLSRMVDCFEAWDANASGTVDKDEWRRACVDELGWTCKSYGAGEVSTHAWGAEQVCDAVFAQYDFDDSGAIEYSEFVRCALRLALQRASGRVIDLFKKCAAGFEL